MDSSHTVLVVSSCPRDKLGFEPTDSYFETVGFVAGLRPGLVTQAFMGGGSYGTICTQTFTRYAMSISAVLSVRTAITRFVFAYIRHPILCNSKWTMSPTYAMYLYTCISYHFQVTVAACDESILSCKEIYSFIHSFIHFNSGSKAHKSTQAEDKKHNTQHKKTEKHKTQG